MKCKRGNVHEFLGMTLYFGRTEGDMHVIQEEHVDDLVSTFQNYEKSEMKGNSPTPASSDLFCKGAGGFLCDEKRECLCTCVAKGIFIGKRSWPDIALKIPVLVGRV